MCIAIPMQVVALDETGATVERENVRQQVDTSFILTPPSVGDWVLVFQNRALRVIGEDEAREVEAALRATAQVMMGDTSEATIRAGFADLIDREPPVPEHLRHLVGQKMRS